MAVAAEDVKKLRQMTGAGILECKKALEAMNNDIEKAIDHLRKEGLLKAGKKLGRTANQGRVFSYIHSNSHIGVLVEVNCETDFAANTDEFIELGKGIAMHIAAENPVAVTRDDIPPEIIEKEREIYTEQVRKEGKPENIIPKIVDGKIEKFYSENVLYEQEYIRDTNMTIEELVKHLIAKVGENVQISRFTRYQIGE